MSHEATESVASYTLGAGTVLVFSLADIAGIAQNLAIIIGCIVIMIRAVHDGIRLYRYLFRKE